MFDEKTSFHVCKVGDHSAITIQRKHVIHLSIYRFRTNLYPYLLEVEEYKKNIFVLKFYRRLHKGSKNKYNLLSNEFKCSRIIGTCFKVFFDIYKNNPLASFGFIGSNTINPSKGEIESKELTKRFKVYRTAVAYKFGEETFSHFENPKHSFYLAVSNKNRSVQEIIDEADKLFEDLIDQN